MNFMGQKITIKHGEVFVYAQLMVHLFDYLKNQISLKLLEYKKVSLVRKTYQWAWLPLFMIA